MKADERSKMRSGRGILLVKEFADASNFYRVKGRVV
jgi:hypothetical protein